VTSPLALAELIPAIHHHLQAAVAESWLGLHEPLQRLLSAQRPEVLLSLAACEAAGGAAADATPVSAAILATEISFLILDDVYDRDRPQAVWRAVGPARACNIAAAFQALSFKILVDASLAPTQRERIVRRLCGGYLAVASGQDQDLTGAPVDLDSYWAIAERKTGAAYATALEAGALVATDDERALQALRTFGYYLGLAAQVFNDLRGIWAPNGLSDLERGKVTLPVVYALGCEHEGRDLLRAIVKEGELPRYQHTVREMLDRIDVRAFLLWAALQHREKALAALGSIPANAGTGFLEDFITGSFGNIDELLQGSGVEDHPGTEQAETPAFCSAALSIRQSLRGALR
jgi:geranylgeranyl pyrophosphate synthase